MAIDPSISLGYRPPQFQMPEIQTPLERFAKVLSLQNLMRQGQLGDIQLQTGRLNLEQLQLEARQNAGLTQYIQNEIKRQQPPQPAAPIALPTPALPPVQPTPVGGTVAQTESPAIAPLQTAPAVTSAPAGPVTIAPDFGLPTKPVPTPAAAPQTGGLGVQQVPGLANLGPSFNYGEIARFGKPGMQFIDQHSKAVDAILKNEDAKAKIIQDNSNRLSSLAQGIVDETTKNSAIATAFYEKRITPEQRDYLRAKPWNDPVFGSFIQQAVKSNEYFTKKREDIASQIAQNEENRKQALFSSEYREKQAKAGTAETEQAVKERAQDAVMLAAAARQGPDALATARAKMDPTRAARFEGLTTPAEFLNAGLTASEAVTTAETKTQHAIQNVLDAAKFAETKKKNDLEFGPGTAESWAANIFENPDAVNEVPANVRSQAQQLFKQKYNLPWPVKLGETALGTQAAARNALDAVDFIRNAMKNPEIQKQIGPIMGHLGNVQETAGTAVGLSPAAATLAQELRTRMRYFVLQEGKAILGGRVPEKLMQQMEQSSARTSMDPSLIEGAVSGAEGAALSTLDNLDRQRFGGKMRTREQRSIGPAAVPAAVQNVLAGEVTKARTSGKATIHQLGDGSVWQVNPDGSITPTTAPK